MDERRRGMEPGGKEKTMIVTEPERFLEMGWMPDIIKNEEDPEKKKLVLQKFIEFIMRMHDRLERQKQARGRLDPAAHVEELDMHAHAFADEALGVALNHWEFVQSQRERGKNRVTGLLNGDAIAPLFSEKIREGRDRQNIGVSVVVRMDADRFKIINDTHGHEAGDVVLRAVAKALDQSVRPTDYALHFSGDEFGLLLTDVKPSEGKSIEETVEDIIRRLIKKVEEIQRPDGQSQTLSVGYRIVEKDEHGFFPQFDHDADEAAGIAKMLQFIPGTEMGSQRIINYRNQKEALEKISPQEFHASKFRAAVKRSRDELLTTLQIDEEELDRRIGVVIELIQQAQAA